MNRNDALRWGQRGETGPAKDRSTDDEDNSPFFWWIRALLAAGGAIALFPVVFAVVVKVIDLGV
jgi:hypothetical protein